jgi:hypothetical protein
LDIKITSGSSVRYRKFSDAIQVSELEVGTFNIREAQTAQVYTIAPGSISADRTLTLPAATGNDTLASIGLAQTFSAAQTFSSGIVSTASANTLGATSFNDAAITNVGDIALDSISADNTDINIAATDNSATAFTIKQGSDAYLIVDTANCSESVSIGTGISGTAITIGHSTSETTVADNLTVTGDMTVNGTTTTVNSTTLTVDDPIITLGGDTAPGSDDNKDRGVEFRYHDGSSARVGFFGYDDSASVFTGLTVATNSSEVFSGTVMNAVFGNIGGTLTTAAQTGITSLGTLTALTVDCVAVNGKVVTMTGSACDTIVMTAAANGAFSLVTTDTAAAAANIQITADGTVDIDSAGVLTLDSGAAINIEPASGSAILLDGTISIDAGVVTGATSITSTAFVGALSTAAQTNITSLGTLTALTVDDVAVDGKVVTMTGSACDTIVMTAAANGAFSLVTTDAAAAAANIQITADGTVDIDSAGVLTLDSGAAINIEPASGSAVLIDGTVSIDGAAITGATSILATDIKIGEDDETKVDFADANIINLHANNIKALSVHNTSSKGDLRLYEGCNYVSITTPALSSDWTLTLPANDGNCGQVLTTNGSGVASWACAGGGLCSNADAIIHNCYGIVIGHTGVLASADHPANTVGEFTMIGAAGGDTGVHIIRHSADAGGGAIRFAKSRNATVASHTKVNSGDTLGEISWFGCDGGDFQPFAATIKVLVDGSPCTNDMPGRMEFSTTKDGAETPTLAMNIASTQEITVHSLKSGSSATTSVQSGLAKAWIVNVADVSGGSACGLASYNVAVSENSTGVRLYTFGTDFGSANYVAVGSAGASAGCNLQAPIFGENTRTAGSICMISRSSGGGNVDVISFNAFFGDQ